MDESPESTEVEKEVPELNSTANGTQMQPTDSSAENTGNNNSDTMDSSANNLPISGNKSETLRSRKENTKESNGTRTQETDELEMQENDVYESKENIVRETSTSSEEDVKEEAGGNKSLKRKKVIKKRKPTAERKVTAKEPPEDSVDSSVVAKNVAEKRAVYENVDLEQNSGGDTLKKRSGHENVTLEKSANTKDIPPYAQVARQRITSDISGRMVIIEGSQYANTDEYSKKVQTLDRMRDDGVFTGGDDDVVILEDEQPVDNNKNWQEDSEEIYGDTEVLADELHPVRTADDDDNEGKKVA